MKKDEILNQLKQAKQKYIEEGFIIKALFGSYARGEETKDSDIDILVEATPQFANKYGFSSFERINTIKKELSNTFGTSVDLADISGMGKTGKKFIIDRAIYV